MLCYICRAMAVLKSRLFPRLFRQVAGAKRGVCKDCAQMLDRIG